MNSFPLKNELTTISSKALGKFDKYTHDFAIQNIKHGPSTRVCYIELKRANRAFTEKNDVLKFKKGHFKLEGRLDSPQKLNIKRNSVFDMSGSENMYPSMK